jgi:hypothetical protein
MREARAAGMANGACNRCDYEQKHRAADKREWVDC